MQIKVDQKAFLDVLKRVDAIVNPKSNIPVLQCVSIEADESGNATLRGSDYETSIREILPVAVAEPGRALLPCKKLRQAVESLSDGELSLSVNENVAVAECEGAEFKLATQSGDANLWDDFPQWEDVEPELSFSVVGDELSRALLAIKDIVIGDPRKCLTGINVSIDGNMVNIVGGSGIALSRAQLSIPEIVGDTSVSAIVPLKTFKAIADNVYDIVHVIVSSGRASFAFGDCVYQCNLIDGKYPNVSMIIPAGREQVISVNQDALIRETKRAKIVCEDKFFPINLEFGENEIFVNARGPMTGVYSNIIAATCFKSDKPICLNGKVLLEILLSIESDADEIEIQINPEKSPVVFKSPDLESHLWLSMPIVGAKALGAGA